MAVTEVDELMDSLYPRLVDHFDDVALVRDAIQMAISELAQNAVEHGASPIGCLLAATRQLIEGQSRLTLAVGDRGIGIPAHLRQRHPDLVVDEHAIATAVQEGVTGTRDADRGHGFQWVLNETLASAATAATMVVVSGRGRFRREIAGSGQPRDSGGPATPSAGTMVVHEWATVVG